MNTGAFFPTNEELERDESAGCYRVRCDWTDQLPSTVVVAAVAAVAETDPLELEPLSETIDPDALDDLFRSTPSGRPRRSGRVEFRVAHHRVVVHAGGTLEVYPPE